MGKAMSTNDQGAWISVADRRPAPGKPIAGFKVRLAVGSMDTKVLETSILGKTDHGEFRFLTGDWQIVTHWWEEANG